MEETLALRNMASMITKEAESPFYLTIENNTFCTFISISLKEPHVTMKPSVAEINFSLVPVKNQSELTPTLSVLLCFLHFLQFT